MGASESKPSSAQVWKASGPNSISSDLADSLKTSPETDASRERMTELHIQARVAEELKKLQKTQSDALKAAHEKLASDKAPGDDKSGVSTHTVNKQVETLRKQLEERKQVRALPDDVDSSRNELVRCLTENDRRPLDCWAEVERFKAEVKKMENGWVDKVTS